MIANYHMLIKWVKLLTGCKSKSRIESSSVIINLNHNSYAVNYWQK